MSKEPIRIGRVKQHLNVAGTRILKYTAKMYHEGLNEHKLISAPETDILKNKVDLQVKKWKIKAEKEASIDEATSRTNEASESLEQIKNILINTLSIEHILDWDSLKKTDKFTEKSPTKPNKNRKIEYPSKPDNESFKFIPVFTVFEKIFKSKKEQKIQEYEVKYSTAVSRWEKQVAIIDDSNKQSDKDFEVELKKWKTLVVKWEKRKKTFLQEQSEFNDKINHMRDSYLSLNDDSIIEYCEMVLSNSESPDSFPENFELEYSQTNRILILEYELPSVECFPKVKEVKYIATRKKLKETLISESQMNKMFDEALYQITLQTIHELFEADVVNALEAISFNGWVKAINKANGKQENNCILSIQVKKNEFIEIDLSKVDPKTCFKQLKGVAASKLSGLTPVQPILQISRTDKRFVEGFAVASQIDNTTNLAAMDWEDFEHLIRELFEKEFQTGGGEVKVTQASRDGGVDAIAFDPDPIRGGKIVIQAKRYTNTVEVSAVRDLYGTVLNEGATKGILVSCQVCKVV